MDPTSLGLLVAAVIFNGLLAGGSVEKSLVELPARHKMDLLSFVEFSRAADLGRGLRYYAVIGVAAPILTIAAAVAIALEGMLPALVVDAAYVAAILSIGHLLATAGAAPKMLTFRQEGISRERAETVYRAFERWQVVRAALQLATFITSLAVLVLSVG